MQVCLEEADDLLLGLARELRLSMSVDEAHRRAEALFKKEQQLRIGGVTSQP